ncbi:hypothetical protein ACFSS9_03525 [Paenibacillus septentrionalis]|uniref:ABC transporter permease subunit n=1 Tax=Paenibacillus septentrionalis TaxID=429342 RepID=UPI00363F5EC9
MKRTVLTFIIAALLLVLPLLLGQVSDFWLHVVIMIGVFSILSMGLNVIIGYAGQFALGHAAFYGIGAYTAALLLIHYNLSFWLVLPIAAVITGFFWFFIRDARYSPAR